MSRSALQDAKLGDKLVDPYGEVWEVIAYTDQPTYTLERVKMATAFDHTRNSVIPASPWAHEWKRLPETH